MESKEDKRADVKQIEVEAGLQLSRIVASEKVLTSHKVDKHSILFIYSPDKPCDLEWPDHNKNHLMGSVQILVYSYPLKDTRVLLGQQPDSTAYVLKISISCLHRFFGIDFGSNPDEVQSIVGSFRFKQLFSEKSVSPAASVIFHQIAEYDEEGPLARLYYHGKIMELLSLYMKKPKKDNSLAMQCPFINDHLEMKKIREARDLIVKNLISPPNLKELAHMVGTNEFKLKVGFKSMFGNTVFGYLNDYRMDKARYMLEQKTYSVKETSLMVGYSNPSHFIAAYKKKFGITPKKYLMAQD